MPSTKRDAARFLVGEHELSVARACRCVGLTRLAFYRLPPHWTVRDAQVIAALASLVEGRPNRGFWKCRKLLRRLGVPWNHKKIHRVYRLMGLHLVRSLSWLFG